MYIEQKSRRSEWPRKNRPSNLLEIRPLPTTAAGRFQALDGGFKANYFDVESRAEYWNQVAAKKTGRDRLYLA